MPRSITVVTAIAVAVVLGLAARAVAVHTNTSCADCHVPHRSGAPTDTAGHTSYGVPLWSTAHQTSPLPTYTLYDSPTFLARATITQPDGTSRMCLGCHDGSYNYAWNPDDVFGPNSLTNTHPISFVYDSALAAADRGLRDPNTAMSGLGGTIAHDLLDSKSKMQCTSCHDVHSSGQTQYMLRFPYEASNDTQFCRVCHSQ